MAVKLHKRINKTESEEKRFYLVDSPEEINICLTCPLPECKTQEKTCERLKAELKKLKEEKGGKK